MKWRSDSLVYFYWQSPRPLLGISKGEFSHKTSPSLLHGNRHQSYHVQKAVYERVWTCNSGESNQALALWNYAARIRQVTHATFPAEIQQTEQCTSSVVTSSLDRPFARLIKSGQPDWSPHLLGMDWGPLAITEDPLPPPSIHCHHMYGHSCHIPGWLPKDWATHLQCGNLISWTALRMPN